MDMPARGHRNPDAKRVVFQVRISKATRTAHERAAQRSGYGSVSKWARALLGAAAGTDEEQQARAAHAEGGQQEEGQ